MHGCAGNERGSDMDDRLMTAQTRSPISNPELLRWRDSSVLSAANTDGELGNAVRAALHGSWRAQRESRWRIWGSWEGLTGGD